MTSRGVFFTESDQFDFSAVYCPGQLLVSRNEDSIHQHIKMQIVHLSKQELRDNRYFQAVIPSTFRTCAPPVTMRMDNFMFQSEAQYYGQIHDNLILLELNIEIRYNYGSEIALDTITSLSQLVGNLKHHFVNANQTTKKGKGFLRETFGGSISEVAASDNSALKHIKWTLPPYYGVFVEAQYQKFFALLGFERYLTDYSTRNNQYRGIRNANPKAATIISSSSFPQEVDFDFMYRGTEGERLSDDVSDEWPNHRPNKLFFYHVVEIDAAITPRGISFDPALWPPCKESVQFIWKFFDQALHDKGFAPDLFQIRKHENKYVVVLTNAFLLNLTKASSGDKYATIITRVSQHFKEITSMVVTPRLGKDGILLFVIEPSSESGIQQELPNNFVVFLRDCSTANYHLKEAGKTACVISNRQGMRNLDVLLYDRVSEGATVNFEILDSNARLLNLFALGLNSTRLYVSCNISFISNSSQ